MTKPNTAPSLARPDEIYQRLVALHFGLSDSDSLLALSRLVLLLANHIGDDAVVTAAIDLAHTTVPSAGAAPLSRQA
jgi:hypothetical protein